MGGYSNIAVRDSQGNIIGYQSTSTGQTSLGTGDINYANPITQQSFNNFNAINAQYEASRNRVIGGDGVMYRGPTYQVNPYRADTAAGIAWEVARTGGATDVRLNRIAEQEVIRSGGDPGFIRYATDIYAERPRFAQETLVTKQGQTFVNPAWEGVPIRLNLTKAEMAAGGGITEQTAGKYLRYDPESFMLNRLTAPPASIGVDTGVHKARGDFGGPILQPDGSYGGWMPRSTGNGSRQVFTESRVLGVGVSVKSSILPTWESQKSKFSPEQQRNIEWGLGASRAQAEDFFASTTPVGERIRPSDFSLETTRLFGAGIGSQALIGVSDFFVGGATKETLNARGQVIGITPVDSGFEYGAGKFAEKVTKPVIPELKYRDTGNAPMNYLEAGGIGIVSGVREKPLQSAMNVGVGALLVFGGEAVIGAGALATTATTGTRFAPAVGAMNLFSTKVAPTVLTGLYGADVVQRSTNAKLFYGTPGAPLGMKMTGDLSPASAQRGGTIFSTEVGPFILGGAAAAYRGNIAAFASTQRSRISQFDWEGSAAGKRYRFDNELAQFDLSGGTPGKIKTIDLRDVKTIDLSRNVPTSVEFGGNVLESKPTVRQKPTSIVGERVLAHEPQIKTIRISESEPIRLARPDITEGIFPMDIISKPKMKSTAYSPFEIQPQPARVSTGKIPTPQPSRGGMLELTQTSPQIEMVDMRQTVDLSRMGFDIMEAKPANLTGRKLTLRERALSVSGQESLSGRYGFSRKQSRVAKEQGLIRLNEMKISRSADSLRDAYTEVFSNRMPEKAISQLNFADALMRSPQMRNSDLMRPMLTTKPSKTSYKKMLMDETMGPRGIPAVPAQQKRWMPEETMGREKMRPQDIVGKIPVRFMVGKPNSITGTKPEPTIPRKSFVGKIPDKLPDIMRTPTSRVPRVPTIPQRGWPELPKPPKPTPPDTPWKPDPYVGEPPPPTVPVVGFPFEPSGGGDSGGGRRRGIFSFREIIPAKGLLFRELPAPKGKYVAEDRLYRKETDQLTGKTRKKYYGKLVDRATIVTKRKTVFKRKR